LGAHPITSNNKFRPNTSWKKRKEKQIDDFADFPGKNLAKLNGGCSMYLTVVWMSSFRSIIYLPLRIVVV
jgi:hypothetical protein